MIEPSLSSASPAAPAGTYNVLQEEGGNTANRRKKHYLYVHSTNNPLSRVSTSSVLLLYFIISLLYSNCLTTLQAAAGAAHRSRAPSNCLFIAGRMEWK